MVLVAPATAPVFADSLPAMQAGVGRVTDFAKQLPRTPCAAASTHEDFAP